jgi:hypothetical protein
MTLSSTGDEGGLGVEQVARLLHGQHHQAQTVDAHIPKEQNPDVAQHPTRAAACFSTSLQESVFEKLEVHRVALREAKAEAARYWDLDLGGAFL